MLTTTETLLLEKAFSSTMYISMYIGSILHLFMDAEVDLMMEKE
jgi:hypothetical protein